MNKTAADVKLKGMQRSQRRMKIVTLFALALAFFGVTAGLLIAFIRPSTNSLPPQTLPKTPPSVPVGWVLTEDQLDNGNFETLGVPASRALGWTGQYELLDTVATKKRDYPTFNINTVKPIPFDPGQHILRLYFNSSGAPQVHSFFSLKKFP